MIEKPAIIITSLGRTGTKFFANLFGQIIPHSTALHEPDVLTIGRHTSLIQQFIEAGVYNLVVRKILLREWSVIELSDARVTGRMDRAEVARRLLKQRQNFVCSKKGRVYIESNLGYYGIIDVLNDVYRSCRVVYLVRDGRHWVRSFMNRGAKRLGPMYAKGKVMSKITHTWPTPFDFEDDPYCSRWPTMPRFERLCWAWAKLNRYALKSIALNPNARLVRFEDIFASKKEYQPLVELLQFTTAPLQLDPVGPQLLAEWLDRQVNQTSGQFPDWNYWSAEHKNAFREICGSLMEDLNYRID